MATYNSDKTCHSYLMARILGASKVTVRFQISIPEEVRKMLKIRDGQTVVFIEEGGKVVLRSEF
jgi:AbrB family looped-hinge helix DNA binding protein